MATSTTTTRKTATPRKRASAKAPVPAVENDVNDVTPGVSTADGETRVQMTLEQLDDTKSYAVFQPPTDSGCVGKLYVPHGTTVVKVLLIGPAE